MGFYADSYDGQLLIPIKHEEAFNSVLNKIYGKKLDSDCITVSGFEICRDGDYISVDSFSDKWTSWEDDFIREIAPFVEDGSYMCFDAGDFTNWRIVYNNGQLGEQYGDTLRIWDTANATVKHLDKESNFVSDVNAPTGSYFYFKEDDVQLVKELLESNNIDYASGNSLTNLFDSNHVTYTCL